MRRSTSTQARPLMAALECSNDSGSISQIMKMRVTRRFKVLGLLGLSSLVATAVAVMALSTASEVIEIQVGHGANDIAVDSVNHRAFVLNPPDGSVSMIDLTGRRLLRTQRLPAPWSCAVTADARLQRVDVLSKCLGANTPVQLIRILDARSGNILKTISISKISTRMISDDRAIIVNGLTDGSLNFFNPQSGALEATLPVAGGFLAPLDLIGDRAHDRAFVYLRDVSPRGAGQEAIAIVDTRIRRVVGVRHISNFDGWYIDSSAGALFIRQFNSTLMVDERTNRIIRRLPVTGQELWGSAADGSGVVRTSTNAHNELAILDAISARMRATTQVPYPQVIAACERHVDRCAIFSADVPNGFPHHTLTVFLPHTGRVVATMHGTDNVSNLSSVAFDAPTHSLLAVSLEGPCTDSGNRWVEIGKRILGNLRVFGPYISPNNQPGTLCIVNLPP